MNPNTTPAPLNQQPSITPDPPSVPPVTSVPQPQFAPQPPVTPQAQPLGPSQPIQPQPLLPEERKETPSAGQIVLQWLTYAFWGWTLLALSVLTGAVVANLISGADTSGFTPYAAAAVLVLLPISFVCDLFYSKKEVSKKSGAEMLVMVIHAVLFALFGIGALITAVFMLVQLLTSSEAGEDNIAGLVTALIITAFYALTFARTLNPAPLGWLQRSFRIIMAVLVGVIIILAIVGPISYERKTRNDKLISSHLSTVSESVRSYTDKNQKLPDNLEALSLNGDAKKLVEKNLVVYKPGASLTTASSDSYAGDSVSQRYASYRYELCVTYKEKSHGYDNYNSYNSSYSDDDYDTSPSVYDHPAGNVCYKLKTSY